MANDYSGMKAMLDSQDKRYDRKMAHKETMARIRTENRQINRLSELELAKQGIQKKTMAGGVSDLLSSTGKAVESVGDGAGKAIESVGDGIRLLA